MVEVNVIFNITNNRRTAVVVGEAHNEINIGDLTEVHSMVHQEGDPGGLIKALLCVGPVANVVAAIHQDSVLHMGNDVTSVESRDILLQCALNRFMQCL